MLDRSDDRSNVKTIRRMVDRTVECGIHKPNRKSLNLAELFAASIVMFKLSFQSRFDLSTAGLSVEMILVYLPRSNLGRTRKFCCAMEENISFGSNEKIVL